MRNNPDVALVLFSVVSPSSFENLRTKVRVASREFPAPPSAPALSIRDACCSGCQRSSTRAPHAPLFLLVRFLHLMRPSFSSPSYRG